LSVFSPTQKARKTAQNRQRRATEGSCQLCWRDTWRKNSNDNNR